MKSYKVWNELELNRTSGPLQGPLVRCHCINLIASLSNLLLHCRLSSIQGLRLAIRALRLRELVSSKPEDRVIILRGMGFSTRGLPLLDCFAAGLGFGVASAFFGFLAFTLAF